MLEEDIKADLFKKMREHSEVVNKIFLLEQEYSQEHAVEELIEEEGHDDYDELQWHKLCLENEIESLLLETRWSVFGRLTARQKAQLDCHSIGTSLDYAENLEKDMDARVLFFKNEMKDRLAKVKSLFLTVPISKRVARLYREAIRCYIFGLFEASSVLCRAISETIVREHIKTTEYADMLYGSDKPRERSLSIGNILKKLSFDRAIVDAYYDIGNVANAILHEKEEATAESDTHETINRLQGFIKGFYNNPDLEVVKI